MAKGGSAYIALCGAQSQPWAVAHCMDKLLALAVLLGVVI